jgi:hypothetical protein
MLASSPTRMRPGLWVSAILSSFGGSLKSLQVSLNTGDDA